MLSFGWNETNNDPLVVGSRREFSPFFWLRSGVQAPKKSGSLPTSTFQNDYIIYCSRGVLQNALAANRPYCNTIP